MATTNDLQRNSFLAGFAVRLGAFICEILCLIILMVGLGRLFHLLDPLSFRGYWLLPLFVLEFVGGFAYYGFCWVKKKQTIVMKIWQIQLLRPDGTAVSWLRAGLRYGILWLFGMIALLPTAVILFTGMKEAFWPFLLAGTSPFWWAIVDREKQFLHDRLSDTRLVVVSSSKMD